MVTRVGYSFFTVQWVSYFEIVFSVVHGFYINILPNCAITGRELVSGMGAEMLSYQLKWTQGMEKDLQMIGLLISAGVRCYQWRIVRNLVCRNRGCRYDRISDGFRRGIRGGANRSGIMKNHMGLHSKSREKHDI